VKYYFGNLWIVVAATRGVTLRGIGHSALRSNPCGCGCRRGDRRLALFVKLLFFATAAHYRQQQFSLLCISFPTFLRARIAAARSGFEIFQGILSKIIKDFK
jgi:hypothetical protein